MNLVDYGDRATSNHLQDTFSRYSGVTFIRTKNKKEQTAGKVVRAVLTYSASFFGTPDIILTDSASRVNWSKFSQFRNGRNITLQTVIHRRQRSLGANGRRSR